MTLADATTGIVEPLIVLGIAAIVGLLWRISFLVGSIKSEIKSHDSRLDHLEVWKEQAAPRLDQVYVYHREHAGGKGETA